MAAISESRPVIQTSSQMWHRGPRSECPYETVVLQLRMRCHRRSRRAPSADLLAAIANRAPRCSCVRRNGFGVKAELGVSAASRKCLRTRLRIACLVGELGTELESQPGKNATDLEVFDRQIHKILVLMRFPFDFSGQPPRVPSPWTISSVSASALIDVRASSPFTNTRI